MKSAVGLALTGGTIVRSLDPPRLTRSDVLVVDGTVASVGGAVPARETRDCSGCLIVPGNVCAHTHLYSALARGMPYRLEPPANFVQILQRIWWRLDRALDEASIRDSALVGGMEALLAGTTTLVDHHASPNAIDGSLDIIADALEEVGIRSVLCYEVTDRDGPDRATAGVRENERFLSARRAISTGMVGAHASFTLSTETLAACVDLAERAGSGIHIHVAEDAADQRDAQGRLGTRVVPRLSAAGAITDGGLLAHCIHLDSEEIAAVRGSGVAVAHNPTSNMNNAVGHAPAGVLGDRVALGTDGIGGDMFEESRSAYFRARDGDVFADIGWPLRRLAEGARLAGSLFDLPSMGSIEEGAPADLAILEYPEVTPIDDGNLAGHWIFGLNAARVRDVLVAGELVVADRRLQRVDGEKIAADARAAAERLWARMDEIEPHPFEPVGGG